ncbi:MAG: response regulator [Gammaproteobacteria bacterium]|nr:response regulator [Gammaproteobacteria bacterium]
MTETEKRILLTDDDPLLQELLEIFLEANGYILYTAQNGKQATDAVKEQQFDLIILDLMMPVMDGQQFLHWLREEHNSTIPVMVLTAMQGQNIEQDLLAAGANAVTFKPLSTNLLMESVNKLLS